MLILGGEEGKKTEKGARELSHTPNRKRRGLPRAFPTFVCEASYLMVAETLVPAMPRL